MWSEGIWICVLTSELLRKIKGKEKRANDVLGARVVHAHESRPMCNEEQKE